VSDLIDTTEMYLRTIYELGEEGIPPLRARIAERLEQSGPTVSQTTARLERDGLLRLAPDRRIELTDSGRALAVRVMRKHRLAERLLTDVIGLEWDAVHAEACRWEHVISDDVERRLLDLLDRPTHSPFGMPIPGLDELAPGASPPQAVEHLPLSRVAVDEVARWIVVQIAETLQEDAELMAALRRSGVQPGAMVKVRGCGDGQVMVGSGGEYVELTQEQSEHVTVARA